MIRLPMPHCNDWLTHSQTLKDRATQLLTKYKSGALVTQQQQQIYAVNFYICDLNPTKVGDSRSKPCPRKRKRHRWASPSLSLTAGRCPMKPWKRSSRTLRKYPWKSKKHCQHKWEGERASEAKIEITLLIVRRVALSSSVLIKKCSRCKFREITDQSVWPGRLPSLICCREDSWIAADSISHTWK